MISTPVALLVLLSALMHAGWNYLVKASPDRLLDMVGLSLGGCALSACLLPFFPLPARECWPWLGVTVFVHVGYFLALLAAYRHADLSLAYPLMRGLAPALVALAAPAMGEILHPALLAGIALVGAGITLPVWLSLRRGQATRSGLLFACAGAGIIALYTVIDGQGARFSGNAWSYTLWLFFLDAWGILAVALWRRGAPVLGHLRRRWLPSLAGGVLTLGSYGIVLWAMTRASIPAVAALRETSVIFAAVLGTWLLGERMGRWRVLGSALVASGGVLIRFA